MTLGEKRVFIYKSRGNMKMKTQFAYLYVILPLFIIGLYQQINQNDPTHHVKTAYMKDDFVLLKISQSGYHKITKNRSQHPNRILVRIRQ